MIAPSSMLDGLTFSEGPEDLYRCVSCRQLRPHEGGEPQPFGEICCAECGAEPVRCENCLHTYPRREFVTPEGLDTLCGPCAYARDMANGSLQ